MSEFLFTPATKVNTKVRIALHGPYGSGKTWTALTLARGFGGRTGLVDTERRRALHYADTFEFHHLPQETFAPQDLTRIVVAAGQQGIDNLIVDTASPYWSGASGMLDQVGRASRDFEGWKEMRPHEREMLDALMSFPGQVIVNLRVKMAYEVGRNDQGKMEPRRIGLRPEQRDGIEHEFDFVGQMTPGPGAGATMTVTKSMCRELSVGTVIERPDEQVAETLDAWLRRDAVGEPFNPYTVADWALQPQRDLDELRDRFEELDRAGQSGAVVPNPWPSQGGGDVITIGNLIKKRGHEIRKAAEARSGALAPAGA